MRSLVGKLNGLRGVAAGGILAVGLFTVPANAKFRDCSAVDLASLQACVNTAALNSDTAQSDTVRVSVSVGATTAYTGAQLRINNRKNLWITGDTTGDETSRPHLQYQDRVHVYTDTLARLRNDTTAAGTFGQNNGTVWIYNSANIKLQGLIIDGNRAIGATTQRIFAYSATLGKSGTVEVRGNVGVNVSLSRDVQLRHLSVTNAWYGIVVLSPNLGGAYSFPDPNDPRAEVVATMPTSQAGKYGNHLIERCRIYDNVTGVFFWRDWDLASIVRNNLFWGNYLRHWSDPRFSSSDYIANLKTIDNTPWFNGKTDNLKWTTVGGAIYTTDVALTPYRIHNNTFFNNSTTIGAHYKGGTQHLFYNNLVGRPFQFYRSAVVLGTGAGDYTQTERQNEMLQYFSEHQRANRVVSQDGLTPDVERANPLHIWNPDSANLRLFRMRMSKLLSPQKDQWVNGGGRSWSNSTNVQDSLPMTWVPDTATGATSVQTLSDTGGVVKWIRHNMWAGTVPDIQDGLTGGDWSPPYLANGIRRFLAPNVDSVFRDVSGFDIRWTLGLPLDTSSPSSPTWLAPVATEKLRIQNGGWTTYEGTGPGSTAVGALTSQGKWAAPTRRLILRDTLIETIKGGLVKFNMNISGQGISNDDIVDLKITSAKFYNDVPVSDTIYNQGGNPVVTRPNSILSRKAWVSPYNFVPTDYNRATYKVDDSLRVGKLRPDQTFMGVISNPAKWLPDTQLYARAEVVLQATLKDGTILYSNPGVFMFSRPRFQFEIRLTDLLGNDLPLDGDSISRQVTARQPIRVIIKAKTLANLLPVPFKGYANLQMGDAGRLHGPDKQQLQKDLGQVWSVRNPNDTVKRYMAKTDSVVDTLRVLFAPVNGTLIYRAVFQGSNDSLLPYFLEGRSDPIRVVSGSIYQVTIDSISLDTTLLTNPSVPLKVYANDSLGGKRDTVLTDGVTRSSNLTDAQRGDLLKVVLQVRDRWGNPVDTSSAEKGLYLNFSYILTPGRFALSTTDPTMITIDSGAVSKSSVQLSFNKNGRAYANIEVSPLAARGVIAGLRAAIIDSNGKELGTPGAARNAGVPDTTWIRTTGAPIIVQWVDVAGVRLNPFTGWVGSWYPVRLKVIKERKGTIYTGRVGLSPSIPLRFHGAVGDTTRLTSATFNGDSLSQVIWLRADDSTSIGSIQAASDSSSDKVSNLVFLYPSVTRSAFYDKNCDGQVDSLSVVFNGPVAFRSANQVVAGDSLNLLFARHYLTPSAAGRPSRIWVQDSVVGFAWDPQAVGAAGPFASQVVLINPLSGRKLSYSLIGMKDKAPPVFEKAEDWQSWTSQGATDSVVLHFSEAIDLSGFGIGASAPFARVRNGVAFPLTTSRLVRPVVVVDSGVYAFVFSNPAGIFQVGDSVSAYPDSLLDLAGNPLSSCHTTLPISVSTPFHPKDGYVLDVDGDGNADSVHLAFQDSLGSLPDRIFVRWGTPAETLTVLKSDLIALGVKTSDTAFSVPTKDWHGQTIVIDGKTLTNVPRTVGPWDSAWYIGTTLRSWLADRVPPVVVLVRQMRGMSAAANGLTYDTVLVDFSETVGGCAVGSNPSACVDLRDRNTKAKIDLPAGTVLNSTKQGQAGTQWTLLVPQDRNPITPNTELRGTPKSLGGNLIDVAYNAPGDKSPWKQVLTDVAPPNRGYMLDRNGDGKVDAVLLVYSSNRKPTGLSLPSFEFEWGSSSGAPVTLRSDSSYKVDSTHWLAILNAPGDFGATGYAPASTRYLGKQLTLTEYKFPVSDSVGPVLKPPAILHPSADSAGYDTLIVWPSEPMAMPLAGALLEFRHNGIVIPSTQVSFHLSTPIGDGSWQVILQAGNKYRPNPGDDVRLSTSGSARDTVGSGNVPHPDHPWVPLGGDLRKPYFAAYYDLTKDGRIETAVVKFAAPVPVGTKIRAYDPAGTPDFREYTVLPADTSRTSFDLSFPSQPWAQDLTYWTIPDLGALVPAAGSDTSLHGGRFPILDRVEPVILSAKLYLTSDTHTVDTMVVRYSEPIALDPGAKILFQVKSAGNDSDMGHPVSPLWWSIDTAKRTITFYLKPFPRKSDTLNPGANDSIRFTTQVTDLAGNRPGIKAKWTQVTGNKREFLPVPDLTNGLLTQAGKAGDPVNRPTPAGQVYSRATTPDGREVWTYPGPDGKMISTGHTYSPSDPGDYTSGGAAATVFFVTTNVPTKLTVYIYDRVGTFVTTQSVQITQAMIDAVKKSDIGLVDIGIPWFGEDKTNHLVSSGIYPVRLIAYREPSEKEKAAGVSKGSIYNRLMNVGVHLSVK